MYSSYAHAHELKIIAIDSLVKQNQIHSNWGLSSDHHFRDFVLYCKQTPLEHELTVIERPTCILRVQYTHRQTDTHSKREGERERERQRDKRSTAQDIIIWRDKRFPAVHISQHSAGSEADDVIGHVTHHSQVRLPPDTPIWSSPLPLLISEESIYFYFRFCFDPLSIFLNRIPFVEKAVAFWLAAIR